MRTLGGWLLAVLFLLQRMPVALLLRHQQRRDLPGPNEETQDEEKNQACDGHAQHVEDPAQACPSLPFRIIENSLGHGNKGKQQSAVSVRPPPGSVSDRLKYYGTVCS